MAVVLNCNGDAIREIFVGWSGPWKRLCAICHIRYEGFWYAKIRPRCRFERTRCSVDGPESLLREYDGAIYDAPSFAALSFLAEELATRYDELWS